MQQVQGQMVAAWADVAFAQHVHSEYNQCLLTAWATSHCLHDNCALSHASTMQVVLILRANCMCHFQELQQHYYSSLDQAGPAQPSMSPGLRSLYQLALDAPTAS